MSFEARETASRGHIHLKSLMYDFQILTYSHPAILNTKLVRYSYTHYIAR